jgi:BirA family biotin operon repressor/biotin-[acetyl-CoA-carboxylase] ligase
LPANPDSSGPGPAGNDPIDAVWLRRAGGIATVEVLPEATSTMDRGREIAADRQVAVPAVVIAERQTQGRGRRGAGWWQAAGSLATSLVLDGPRAAALPPPTWSLASGVAVAEAIRELAPDVPAVVRWPNDVEVRGRKLAGILVETAPTGRVVIGIGVNTSGSAADAPADLRQRVATLPDVSGWPVSRQRLVAAIVPRLVQLLADMEAAPDVLLGRYRPLCSLTGEFVRVHGGDAVHEGICRGIAADGGLEVDTTAGRVVVRSGSLTPPGGEWRPAPIG